MLSLEENIWDNRLRLQGWINTDVAEGEETPRRILLCQASPVNSASRVPRWLAGQWSQTPISRSQAGVVPCPHFLQQTPVDSGPERHCTRTPFPLDFGQKAVLGSRGGVYFGAPAAGFYTPPLTCTTPLLQGYFQGGVCKSWPSYQGFVQQCL